MRKFKFSSVILSAAILMPIASYAFNINDALNYPKTIFDYEKNRKYQIFQELLSLNFEELTNEFEYQGERNVFNVVLNNQFQSSSDLINLKYILERLAQVRNDYLGKNTPYEYILLQYVEKYILSGTMPSGLLKLSDNFETLENVIGILGRRSCKESADALFQLEIKLRAISFATVVDFNRIYIRADSRVFNSRDWIDLANEAKTYRAKIKHGC